MQVKVSLHQYDLSFSITGKNLFLAKFNFCFVFKGYSVHGWCCEVDGFGNEINESGKGKIESLSTITFYCKNHFVPFSAKYVVVFLTKRIAIG